MNYLEAKKKWESIKDLRELNVFEYELIIIALLEHIAKLEAVEHTLAPDGDCICPPKSDDGHMAWIHGKCPVHGSRSG